MKLEYAVFILLIYILLVLLGIWFYDLRRKQKRWQEPVQLPLLNEREKRRKLNELLEPFGFAYDGRQDIFYSRTDSWQRKYGYGRIYDEGAALLNMILDCEPIYFEYDRILEGPVRHYHRRGGGHLLSAQRESGRRIAAAGADLSMRGGRGYAPDQNGFMEKRKAAVLSAGVPLVADGICIGGIFQAEGAGNGS